MVIELLLLVASVLWTSPLFCSMQSAAAVADFLPAHPPALFDAKIVKNPMSAVEDEDKQLTIVKHRHILAVFIHGTLFPMPSLTAVQEWAEGRFLKKDPQPAAYLDLLRDKGVLRHQPIGPLGLHPVIPAWSPAANGAQLLGWLLQEMYSLLPREDFAHVHAYTFGWDGSLSLERRKAQARDLLHALEALAAEQRRRYPLEDFETIILAHSHGGNVALHMGDWISDAPSFYIDHLVTFGTPVHGDTQHHVISPLFRNVYNVHSNGDFIQIADIVSTKKYMPARVFKHESVTTATHVKQILVEIGEYSPNHSELWFFRRPDVFFFRSSLPTAPLPVVAFTPLLLREIKKTAAGEHFLKLKINPDKQGLHVNIVPFQNYWKNELVKLHQYESRFDFSSLFSQLPLIQNE